MYRFIDHTGEIELAIDASTEDAVFVEALLALRELIDCADGGVRARHEVDVSAGDRALLLVEWLTALVFLAEVEEFVPESVAALELSAGRLRAVVDGRRACPAHLVKAVTLNSLEFRAEDGSWHGHVVLDV